MKQSPVVIINGARTPMGGLLGALSSVPAPDLAQLRSRSLERSGCTRRHRRGFHGLRATRRAEAVSGAAGGHRRRHTQLRRRGHRQQSLWQRHAGRHFGYDSIVAGTNHGRLPAAWKA